MSAEVPEYCIATPFTEVAVAAMQDVLSMEGLDDVEGVLARLIMTATMAEAEAVASVGDLQPKVDELSDEVDFGTEVGQLALEGLLTAQADMALEAGLGDFIIHADDCDGAS